MARKNLQRLGKAAALLGTAFAASKMLGTGTGGEDEAIQKGLEVTRAKPFGMSDDAAMARMAKANQAQNMGLTIARSYPETRTEEFAPDRPGRKVIGKLSGLFNRLGAREDISEFGPMAKEGKFIKASKGTMVVAKVKLGRTKPTKLY